MRRWLLLLLNVVCALCAGGLLLIIWDISFWYLQDYFFLPLLRRHYERIGYSNADPVRDFSVIAAIYGAVMGLTFPLLLAYVLRLRWFILTPMLIGSVYCIAIALKSFPLSVLLGAGHALYVFGAAAFVGAYFGERLRARRIAV
jgi:hypothetical protein